MSEQFQVPRSAIRDALSVLEAEKRIVRIVGSGTYVAAPNDTTPVKGFERSTQSDTSPAEIMEARLLVEPRLAVLVIANATAADFERMDNCNRHAERADGFEEFEHWDA